MKITKTTEYKKPLYALGVAAMIAATMTGCGKSNDVDLAGATTVYEDPDKDKHLDLEGATTVDDGSDRDVELAGDVSIAVDIEPEYDEPIELDGDVAICVDDDPLQLDGVIEMPVDDDMELSKQPAPSEDKTEDNTEDEAEEKTADEVVYIPILEYGEHLVLDGGVSIDDPYGN
jgi:hypothetical protein